jgi:glycosyltransferase involved in cell wall biosynthesis
MINPIRPDYLNTPVSPERPSFLYRPAIAGLSPTVSVVTPFFNAGAVFHETARSVLGQSFQRWEWIIVNNGSDQAESLRVLDAYRSADARIRVVDLAANSGPSGARNAGVARARSDFVVFLDADDLLEPTMIEKCLWHLYSHPSDAFVGAYNVGFGAQRYLWTEGFASGAKFLRQNCSVATCMIRRQVHQDVGGFDSGNAEGLEDWDYWLRLASRGHWGGTVPE